MMSRPYIVAHTATLSVLLMYFVLTGCHSSSTNSTPAVAFDKVSAAYQESPNKTDITKSDYETDIIDGRAAPWHRGRTISVTRDGKELALRTLEQQSDVYIAELEAGGQRLSAPPRLTPRRSGRFCVLGMPDSRAVLYLSDRDGPLHIFRQAVD